MNPKKNILIFTSDSGYGHRSAANAINGALQQLYGSNSVVRICNPINDLDELNLIRIAESQYDVSVRYMPGCYRLAYELSDSRKASSILDLAFRISLIDQIIELINEFQPHAILNTNEIFNEPIGHALRQLGKKIPYFTVITDFGHVHALWFNPHPDHYFVASENVRQQALSLGLPKEKISITGIPVDYHFASLDADKGKCRQALGLNPHKQTILVVGSKRVTHIYQCLKQLNHCTSDFQVVMIAGGDEKTYQKIVSTDWHFPIVVKQVVDNMYAWMGAADILLTKAGGLILSEALAAALPTILINNLPGQETGNVDYVLNHKAAILLNTVKDLPVIVDSLLQEESVLKQTVTANAASIGHPEASQVIAKHLWCASTRNDNYFIQEEKQGYRYPMYSA